MSLSDVISVKDAAILLMLSNSHVLFLIRGGKLPAKNLGRDYALLRQDVEAYKATMRKYKPSSIHPFRQYKTEEKTL